MHTELITINDQASANQLLPGLLQMDVDCRGVLIRDATEPIDLTQLRDDGTEGGFSWDALAGGIWQKTGRQRRYRQVRTSPSLDLVEIDYRVPENIRAFLIKQCEAARVPVRVIEPSAPENGNHIGVIMLADRASIDFHSEPVKIEVKDVGTAADREEIMELMGSEAFDDILKEFGVSEKDIDRYWSGWWEFEEMGI